MSASADLVTVYRSMDAAAKEDCEALVDMLLDEGISAVMLDDDSPGLVQGTFEVRVPARNAPEAEKLIAENQLPDEVEEVDDSSDLDLETVFHAEGSGSLAEMQAMNLKNLLESNGIAAVLVGDSVLPNFPFEIRVAREQADLARRLIADAEESGPIGADEVERQSGF
jgi:putative signal transducing protein